MDYAEKMQRCHEYVEALEEERRKIQVFQRELPLCLELVTQAIEACRRELSGTTTDFMHGQSECSEQTSSDGPVLEEFIPIKRTHSSSDVNDNDDDRDHEQRSRKRNRGGAGSNINNEKASSSNNNNNSDHKKKSDWLRSVQLWNQSPDPPPATLELPREAVVTEVKKDGVGGAFHPFRREKSNAKTSTDNQMAKKTASSVPASATSPMAETETVTVTAGANDGGGGGNSNGEEKDGQTQRKQRRCWSPELHRRFLQALQQLGGSHAATPKQIRELMKVDGLTNDEVKSHLQKYRLHTRRPSPGIHSTTSTQAPQFVVVGGIWVPPPEYAAVATTTSRETATIAASHGIYAPLAAPPPKTQHASNSAAQKKSQHSESDHLPSEGRGSHSEEGHHSNSPSTSSTTHTTTNSPEF